MAVVVAERVEPFSEPTTVGLDGPTIGRPQDRYQGSSGPTSNMWAAAGAAGAAGGALAGILACASTLWSTRRTSRQLQQQHRELRESIAVTHSESLGAVKATEGVVAAASRVAVIEYQLADLAKLLDEYEEYGDANSSGGSVGAVRL